MTSIEFESPPKTVQQLSFTIIRNGGASGLQQNSSACTTSLERRTGPKVSHHDAPPPSHSPIVLTQHGEPPPGLLPIGPVGPAGSPPVLHALPPSKTSSGRPTSNSFSRAFDFHKRQMQHRILWYGYWIRDIPRRMWLKSKYANGYVKEHTGTTSRFVRRE